MEYTKPKMEIIDLEDAEIMTNEDVVMESVETGIG